MVSMVDVPMSANGEDADPSLGTNDAPKVEALADREILGDPGKLRMKSCVSNPSSVETKIGGYESAHINSTSTFKWGEMAGMGKQNKAGKPKASTAMPKIKSLSSAKARADTEDSYARLMADPNNTDLKEAYINNRKRGAYLAEAEVSYLSQRAKLSMALMWIWSRLAH
ncbi:hypothetical protein Dimus_013478 [Dionaea muscipula]